jgi:hypothetical protein
MREKAPRFVSLPPPSISPSSSLTKVDGKKKKTMQERKRKRNETRAAAENLRAAKQTKIFPLLPREKEWKGF